MCRSSRYFIAMSAVAPIMLVCLANISHAGDTPDTVRATIEADWARQEASRDRIAGDAESIRAALDRCERLVADLAGMENGPPVDEVQTRLPKLKAWTEKVDKLDEDQRLALYHDIRWLARDTALTNPLFAGTRLAFMERRRFICQMLHEYLGYYYDYGDLDGGGVYILDNPGHSFKTIDLVGGMFPKGNYTTLALSYDAKTLYFGFAPRAAEKPDYYSPDKKCFDIYALDLATRKLRQLTSGPDDDFDPCPLPDGGIAFMSSRRGGFTRCNNPWEPLPAHTLHRMDADGGNVRMLSCHETSEWHPSVLWDGTICYIRWDYVDRSAAHFHGLWLTNPDGSNTRSLFGNYTQNINACYQPKPVPGSNKIVFLAGAHHANVGGSIVLLDPSRVALDGESGQDSFDAIECLTPEVCYPEAPGWPPTYYHSPWPLSEDYFLVAYSFDPLPGMGPKVEEDTKTGLYLFDRFGNLELLYRNPDISAMYPLPLRRRPVPPQVASTLNPEWGDEGEFVLADVDRSFFGMPTGRPVKEIRVFQVLPKSETHIANKPRIGYANAESARMLLGTVPVEKDGSAYFRAPAQRPLLFQAVDAEGRAVQGMRSVVYVQPGERRSCVGCHEPVAETPTVTVPIATRRAPSVISPGPDGTHPWSFVRLMQPILDQHCTQCHDGAEKSPGPDLNGTHALEFTASYQNLRPYVRWYEWGGESIRGIITKPAEMPADVSPLVAILNDDNHASELKLTDAERRRIYLWLDGNAAFYGAYSPRERLAQKRGEVILPPVLQ